MSGRVRYGVDAPGVMLGLLGAGAGVMAAGGGLALVSAWGWLAVAAGAVPLLLGLAMLAYALAGKMRMRDRMLAAVAWTGREQVLDVGTGAGLLLVGAAQRLTTGRAVGVDLWVAKDLSGNSLARAEANLVAAGVADRARVQTADAAALPFADGTFDVVLSLLCLHNVASPERACTEIARVCKPGGRVVVADYVPTGGYGRVLRAAGLDVGPSRARLGVALSLMWEVQGVRR